jgi:hypothetical protein
MRTTGSVPDGSLHEMIARDRKRSMTRPTLAVVSKLSRPTLGRRMTRHLSFQVREDSCGLVNTKEGWEFLVDTRSWPTTPKLVRFASRGPTGRYVGQIIRPVT